jgi:hypothetical protein
MRKLKSITVEWIETACCSVTFTERDLRDFELEFGRRPTQADLKMIAVGCPTAPTFGTAVRPAISASSTRPEVGRARRIDPG